MANLLTMADIQAILHLHEQGWRQRRIARELHVDRETVAKYIRASRCVPKPATAPLGFDVAGDQGQDSLAWPLEADGLREAGGNVVRASLGEGPEAPGPSPKPSPPSLFSVFRFTNPGQEFLP